MDLEMFSLICGIISLITVAGSMLFKNIKTVLTINFICNIAGALPYLINGQISACGLYFVAAAQCIVFLGYRIFKKEPPKYYTGVFSAVFLLVSVLGYQKPLDVIAMLAAITCALALAQKTSKMYRVIMVLNGVLWLIFDILTKTYNMLPAHIITAAAAVIGIIRLDICCRRKSVKANDNTSMTDGTEKKADGEKTEDIADTTK